MSTDDDGVWVGVDLGTQSVRAVAVAGDGTVLGSGSSPLGSRRDAGRHEQDPDAWWAGTASAAGSALRGVRPDRVRGVAVDGTSGTVVLVGADGRQLTPALMYDDNRAAEQAAAVNEAGAAVWKKLGYQRMQPSWALPKVLWLLREHPRAAAHARLASQVDVVNRRLVGADVASDLSNSLKTGADLIAEDWPHDVMDALGVPPGLLPPLVRPGAVLGHVCQAAAEATAIPAGTPVVAGMTDGCAAQLGSGALAPGDWNSVLGTTLVLKGVTASLLSDPSGVVYSHRAPDGGWLPGGASSTGAGAVSRGWPGADLPAMDQAARDAGPAHVVSYPLTQQGERFPFAAPAARGFTLGTPANDAEAYAAVLEGVAYVERLCFDSLRLLGASIDGDVVLSGGAARSEHWNQLRADVLGRPLTLTRDPEPALGMAVLAASGGSGLAAAAARMVHVLRVVEPRAANAGRYDESYLALVDALQQRGWLAAPVADAARQGAGG